MRKATVQFDASKVFALCPGIQEQLAGLSADLEKLRDEIFDADVRMAGGQLAIPRAKQPHGGAFVTLPQQQLLSYYTSRDESPLGQLLTFTKYLMLQVDRVVVVGPATMLAGPRAIMGACCQPYYNELSRADRGSRPRVTFAGDDIDSDQLQGLLHLLGAHRGKAANEVADSWGLVVIRSGNPTPETELATEQLQSALVTSCGGDALLVRQRLMSVEMHGAAPLPHAGCRLQVPPHVSEHFSVLSPVGLAPAAILGVNIMKLQEGALAVNEHFTHTKAADNRVLKAAATAHLLNQLGYQNIIAPWDLSLEQAGHWALALLAGCNPRLPIVMCGVRDVHRYADSLKRAQHSGNSRRCIEVLATEQYRFDVLPTGTSQEAAPARLAESVNSGFLAEAACPSLRWTLPSTDEFSFGQFLQAKMLSAVVEARLAGANPYALEALGLFRGRIGNIVSKS